KRGSELFDKIGCASCHVRTMTTGEAGTKINGGTFTIPEALGSKSFHPYGDFLLHNVGTGDGIVIPMEEHYGRAMRTAQSRSLSPPDFHHSANKLRTAPLWGLRLRTRLMHDGASVTLSDAIKRHRGEAERSRSSFERLSAADREALLEFLKSL